MNWYKCIGNNGGGGGITPVFKNYAKFNGNGVNLPWTQDADYKLECVFYEAEYRHDTCITGNSGGYTQGQYIAPYNTRFDVGVGNGFSNLGSWSAGEHTYINNDEDNKSTLDGTASANYIPTTNNYYYTLGCRENGSMGYYGYIKSFKIYSKSTGDLLHHLKPCLLGNLAVFCDVADNNNFYAISGLQAVDSIPS